MVSPLPRRFWWQNCWPMKLWQPFQSFVFDYMPIIFSFRGWRRGYWQKRAMCDTPSLLHHCCVFYKPENLKMWFFISPKLEILEAWLFQDRKTIVLEKNWRQNCLGQLWWLFVQISISGTSLTIAFFDFCLELYFLYIYEFKIIYNVLKCFI